MTTTFAPRPTVGASAQYAFPVPVGATLDNGLQIEHLPHHGGLVTFLLVTRCGAWHEPVGLEGVGSLATALRVEGTPNHTGEQLAAAFDLIGADITATTGEGASTVQVVTSAARAHEALALLAETVRPTLPDPEVTRVRDHQAATAVADASSPAVRAGHALLRACFETGDRAALATGGSNRSIAALTREDVEAFTDRGLDPRRTTLVVGGMGTTAEVVAAADGRLGGWRASNGTPTIHDPSSRPTTSAGVVVVNRPGAVQTEIRLGAPCPGREDPRYAPLRVAAHVWGGSMYSRLSAVLREEKGYTYGVFGYVQPLPDRGLLTMSTSVDATVTEPALADAWRITEQVGTSGITDSECRGAIDELRLKAPLALQTASAVAQHRAGQVAEGLAPGWLADHYAQLSAVTATDASGAVAQALDVQTPRLALVGDAELIVRALDAVLPGVPVVVEEV